MIAITNRSTVATDAEVRLATRACGYQLRNHCAPAWGLKPVSVGFFREPPAGSWPIYVLDDSDMQNALGWHSTDNHGVPYGRVFARTTREAGWYLSVVLSHEVMEAFVDPSVAEYRHGIALEVGDPVESDTYTVSLRREEDESHRHRVRVSDFCLPAWWDPTAFPPYDHLGLCRHPQQVRPGGYVISGGQARAHQVPMWRIPGKFAPGARTWRRLCR